MGDAPSIEEAAKSGTGKTTGFVIGANAVSPGAPVSADAEAPASPPRNYSAPAFNAPDLEKQLGKRPTPLLEDETREFERYRRVSEVNWIGMAVFLCYLAALAFYLWVRITKTLDLGQFQWYGILVLVIECLGATTVILYGINLLRMPVATYHVQEDPSSPGKPFTRHPYHVRVLVPCYKEGLDILRRTVMAAYDATLPEGCERTIYLLDDGKDIKKRKWVETLGADVVYVSGRKREPGEMNGKSGNLNNVCSQLYPKGAPIPSTELLCIFDADQVASKEFFLKTLPLFDSGDDIAMVLSPQCFHNLNLHSDIFNHSNVHFWEYMQPGYDALGFISCTGTNFLVRSTAMMEVGGSPTWTLTEDFALGMELKKYGWNCRYVQEYLAIGEAPDQIRNCYQQRSRWCKGHFQILFNFEHCPLFQRRLSIFMRIMYMSGVWAYIVGALSTPTFIIIPIVTIWGGVFPIVVSQWAAIGLTVYMVATHAVLYYVRSPKHLEALWFSNIANTLMWFTYVKALYSALSSVTLGKTIQFKTTLKGAAMLMNTAVRDLWMPGLCFILLLATLILGLIKLGTSATIASPLCISIVWIVYALIPEALVMYYACVSKACLLADYELSKCRASANGVSLQYVCRICMVLSFFSAACAVGLMWGLYPKEYDLGHVLSLSSYFYNAQRAGHLPPDNGVPWRSDALLWETGPGEIDLTGGWLNGGSAGDLKMSVPTAFTTSLVAWGMLAFPAGYAAANQTYAGQQSVRWGADYLLKTLIANSTGGNVSSIVYQVGNYTIDQTYWGRPEDIPRTVSGYPTRPAFTAPASHASDLGGAIVAALAASSLVFRSTDPGYSTTLLSAAFDLYAVVTDSANHGLYGDVATFKACVGPFAKGSTGAQCIPASVQLNGSAVPLYNGTTYYDCLLWAATWMYKATGDGAYLDDATTFYVAHLYDETGSERLVFDWTSYYWASCVLLAQLTDGGTYHERSQHFMRMWVCGIDQVVAYTPRGRAYNSASGSLGSTANAAFLATTYGAYELPSNPALASRYVCWARSQIRYMLGDADQSYVVGYGRNAPTHADNRAASCPPPPQQCSAVSGLLNPQPNPNVLSGALVEGALFSDVFQDVRILNSTNVEIEFNAGFQGVLAGLSQASGTWEQCLQGYGGLGRVSTVCGNA
ncbi:hypothetical protein WJX81_004432 [Elliptochloris bilobata]|uniref:cellulase n=1 Tax=Elliptochloris bilobata TaxID=381761 RepID=A0AAW1S7C5_9CHLO